MTLVKQQDRTVQLGERAHPKLVQIEEYVPLPCGKTAAVWAGLVCYPSLSPVPAAVGIGALGCQPKYVRNLVFQDPAVYLGLATNLS